MVPAYFGLTLLVGWLAGRRRDHSAGDYLNASRSLPLWVVTAAYLASNCGALEVVGLSALAAQYGAQAFHFYWIGAIPAMVFLAWIIMPVYRRSGVRSVPEYLLLRFGPRIRLLNALATAVIVLLLSGISLYAMAQVLEVVIGLTFPASILCCSGVVLVYVLAGGIRATIYNEVLQLGVMLCGLLPLAWWSATHTDRHGGQVWRYHLWTNLPLADRHAPFDLTGVVVGLGFVLSFGYWCTDFVLMQRAFAARTESEARQVPLWAGLGKLGFAFVVVLPGLAAAQFLPALGKGQRFDQALPALMRRVYSPSMLGLGLTALAASLMSGLAANVSAFASICTEDIYRTSIARSRSEAHYLRVGRVALVAAVVISVVASYLNFFFTALMEHVQLIFSVFGAPFWAVFLLGMTTRRTTERGAIAGFLSGALFSLLHSAARAWGWLQYGSVMTSNFYAAAYAFTVALAVGWLASGKQSREVDPRLVYDRGLPADHRTSPWLWVLAWVLLLCCAALNFRWR